MRGPKLTTPDDEFHTKCRSVCLDREKSSTSVHSTGPPASVTTTVSPARRGSTGYPLTRNSCAGLPSERPKTSLGALDECSAVTVPPSAATSSDETLGDA